MSLAGIEIPVVSLPVCNWSQLSRFTNIDLNIDLEISTKLDLTYWLLLKQSQCEKKPNPCWLFSTLAILVLKSITGHYCNLFFHPSKYRPVPSPTNSPDRSLRQYWQFSFSCWAHQESWEKFCQSFPLSQVTRLAVRISQKWSGGLGLGSNCSNKQRNADESIGDPAELWLGSVHRVQG